VSIHQPNFLPWLGFFDKVARSDIFILLDDVQFEKNGWQNRNLIKGPEGSQWLTVPILHHSQQLISEVRIDNKGNWRRKHWNSISSNYGKASFFNVYSSVFKEVYQQEWDRLIDLNIHLLGKMFDAMKIKTKICLSSDFQISTTSSSRLASLCSAVEADIYLAGSEGKNYLDSDPFTSLRIQIEYQEYNSPEYSQLFGKFIPHLSGLDFLMNGHAICTRRTLWKKSNKSLSVV